MKKIEITGLMTTKQVAEFYGVKPLQVYRWKEQGKLNTYKTPGGQIRFNRDEIIRSVNATRECKSPYPQLS